MNKLFKTLIVLFFFILPGCVANGWEATDSFFVKDQENYISLIGTKDKFGIKINDRYVAGTPRITEFYFWGLSDYEGKTITVKASSKEQTEAIDLADAVALQKDINYHADATAVASLTFPGKGVWRLDVYIDDQKFSTITVNVE